MARKDSGRLLDSSGGTRCRFREGRASDSEIAILFAALVTSCAFWILDVRNRDFLASCQKAGRAIERSAALGGVYGAFDHLQTPDASFLSLVLVVDILVSSVIAGTCGALALAAPRVLQLRESLSTVLGSIALFFALLCGLQKFRRKQGQRGNTTPIAKRDETPERGSVVSWHGFEPEQAYLLTTVLSVCERRIAEGQVDAVEEKVALLDLMRRYAPGMMVWSPFQPGGWGASPFNPECWQTMEGTRVLRGTEDIP